MPFCLAWRRPADHLIFIAGARLSDAGCSDFGDCGYEGWGYRVDLIPRLVVPAGK